MRGHKQALSAGPTAGRANRLGASLRESFAIRQLPDRVKGSGAAFALVAALCALAVIATPASAAMTHPFESSFGSFESIQSLAVDQSNGDVYALDNSSGGSVSRFTGSGAPHNFTASAPYISGNTLTGTSTGGFGISGGAVETQVAVAPPGAPGGTGGDVYVAESSVGAIAIFAPSGEFLGKIDGSGNTNPVSGGELCGVATDPAGNLYLGYYSGHVDKYVPSANPPLNSDFDSELTGMGGICNVVASSTNLVTIRWFSGPATSYPLSLFPGGGGEANGSSGETPIYDGGNPISTAAVDFSNDDLYLDEQNQIVQFDAAGNVTSRSGGNRLSGSFGVAVDSSGGTSDGNLYAGNKTKVEVFGAAVVVPDATTEAATGIKRQSATLNGTVSAAGGPNASCEFEYVTEARFSAEGFHGASTAPCAPTGPFTGSASQVVSADISGLTVATNYLFRLVASNANGSNPAAALTFTTPNAVNVTTGAASNLTGSGATLNGTINPEGVELAECKFEYGPSESYGHTAPCAESPATIGNGNGPVSVHADVNGLDEGAEYHFRLAAKSSFGEAAGLDATFTTKGPILADQSVVVISDTEANLKAVINPNGDSIAYLFEYVTQSQFEASGYAEATSVPPNGESIEAGTEGVGVSQVVSDLQADTTYHFRVFTGNSFGNANGPDQVFTTYPLPQVSGICPENEAFRLDQSSLLPDCRAYEQVSPMDKNGGDVQGEHDTIRASVSGDAITFVSHAGIPGGVGTQQFPWYLARRNGDDWSTRGLMPPPGLGEQVKIAGLASDLSETFADVTNFDGTQGHLGFYMRDSASGNYTTIVPSDLVEHARPSALSGTSADGSKVYFEGETAFTPDATPGKNNLYVWDRDTHELRLAGVLPDESAPAGGSFAGSYDWYLSGSLNQGGAKKKYYTQAQHVISDSGDAAFFTAGKTGQIYVRKDAAGPSPTTDYVSASQAATPDPNGQKPAAFLAATTSGSKAFFLSCQKLTDDSTAHSTEDNTCLSTSQGQDLYAYDTSSGQLSDLTPDSNSADVCPETAIPCGAQVQGVIGISDSGEYVYFVASGDLDGAGPATTGDCHREADLLSGACSLYLWHNGETKFIARLGGFSDGRNFQPVSYFNESLNNDAFTGRVSADGRVLLFRSTRQLTGYDNQGITELYRYQAGDAAPVCISCNPTGAPPTQSPYLHGINSNGFIFITGEGTVLPRNLSADGNRVFFESADKLVAADTNGDDGCPANGAAASRCQDVYEWEAPGAGTCVQGGPAFARQAGGCLYLISSGKANSPAFFADASASGDDVFIFTREALVPQDGDELVDVYDARVGGGLASQYPVTPPSCEREGCRGSGTGAEGSTGASTASFSGAGNPIHKRHKKRHHKHPRRHGHKHHHKHSGHRTGINHGGAK